MNKSNSNTNNNNQNEKLQNSFDTLSINSLSNNDTNAKSNGKFVEYNKKWEKIIKMSNHC